MKPEAYDVNSLRKLLSDEGKITRSHFAVTRRGVTAEPPEILKLKGVWESLRQTRGSKYPIL